MGEFLSIIKDLNTTLKEIVFLTLVLGSFWTVPFMLFKPDFFNFPFYAQIALIFALTIIWLLTTLFASTQIINKYINPKANPVRIGTIIAILLLNFSILLSYYHTVSFTCFLRYAYCVMGGYFIMVVLIFNLFGLNKK
jgi:hypothetical protein